jgi:hypothetical protein
MPARLVTAMQKTWASRSLFLSMLHGRIAAVRCAQVAIFNP